jgi:tetrapyrrole methylase family protein/MazG family protein
MEETAEVLDALDANDMEGLCEELGDLLLHVVMQAQIATEDGDFTAADVIAGIEAKIRRRHPHVFGQVQVSSAKQVSVRWEAIKERERGRDAKGQSALDGVPLALPTLAQADAYSRRAADVGFDWAAAGDVVAKVREELDELLAARTREERVTEIGDLLFTVVNWARWLEVDPDAALRMAIRRFRERFHTLERAAEARAGGIANLDAEEIERLWRQARPGALAEQD